MTLINLAVIGVSSLFGVILTGIFIGMDRRIIEKTVESRTIRGMFCTLGEVPVHAKALSMSSSAPPKDVYPVEVKNVDFLEIWRSNMSAPLGELMDDILHTLWDHKETPASPLLRREMGEWISDADHNHGGRSLASHSLLVAYLMCEEAKTYKYQVPKFNNVPLYKLNNPNFNLDPTDPLIPILGLAHDIGKIECIVWEDGKPNKMDEGHDYKGARIVARMDAFWHPGIDAESRRIMQSILAHYHHVQNIPMEKDGLPTSDRLHALMELLVKCDKAAGEIENCRDSSAKEIVKQQALAAQPEQLQPADQVKTEAEELLSAVLLVLLGAERINVRDKGSLSSVGWKYFLPQFGRTVVLLKEDSFIKAVADLMGIEITPESRTGGANSVMHLTQSVLKVLNVANLLFNDFEEMDRSVISQLYRADFYKPSDFFLNKELTVPRENHDLVPDSVKFRVESAIVLQIDDYPALQKLKDLPNYTNVFNIGKARLGKQGVRVSKPVDAPFEDLADRIARSKPVATVPSVPPVPPVAVISSSRLSAFIARELAKDEDKRRFSTKIIPASESEAESQILYKFEACLLTDTKMTFEQVKAQDTEWLLAAGISEVCITEKGTKIIRLLVKN